MIKNQPHAMSFAISRLHWVFVLTCLFAPVGDCSSQDRSEQGFARVISFILAIPAKVSQGLSRTERSASEHESQSIRPKKKKVFHPLTRKVLAPDRGPEGSDEFVVAKDRSAFKWQKLFQGSVFQGRQEPVLPISFYYLEEDATTLNNKTLDRKTLKTAMLISRSRHLPGNHTLTNSAFEKVAKRFHRGGVEHSLATELDFSGYAEFSNLIVSRWRIERYYREDGQERFQVDGLNPRNSPWFMPVHTTRQNLRHLNELAA